MHAMSNQTDFRQLSGVNFNSHNLEPGSAPIPGTRHPTPDANHNIDIIPHSVGHRGVHTAEMVCWDNPVSNTKWNNRCTKKLRKLPYISTGVGGATSNHDHRTLRLCHDGRRLGHLVGVHAHVRRTVHEVRNVHYTRGHLIHVGRNLNCNRASSSRQHGFESGTQLSFGFRGICNQRGELGEPFQVPALVLDLMQQPFSFPDPF
mmetsp:Transcript_68790/g.157848  ORF Transcript_68790/g.157848 Transcript_68790/m.157848 type:complete len:204 (+) Transcript_68790:845-1456(+)